MVIFYDIETRDILRTEDNTMVPTLPANMELEEKKAYYRENFEDFISIPYELGINIYNFNLCFDKDNNFIGMQMKEENK